MFQNNDAHLQQPLYSTLDELPSKLKKWLEKSWAGAFHHSFFRQIDEEPFAVLYAEEDSRPNTPVNVLVGLADFIFDTDEQAHPEQLTCPGGQIATAESGREQGRFIVRFDAERYAACPLRGQCIVAPTDRSGKAVLYLDQRQVDRMLRFLRPRDGLYRHLRAKCRRWLPILSASYAIVGS